MYKEKELISGVFQGIALAAILFIIMIPSIDEKIKESIVRCFTDDTNNSKMQDALKIIYGLRRI